MFFFIHAANDFELSMMAPFQLVFLTTESRLPVVFSVNDDNIIELSEEFQLVLSVPGNNPPTGYNIGMFQSALIQIQDNESESKFLRSSSNTKHTSHTCTSIMGK